MYLAPVQPPNQRLPDRVYAARRLVAAIVVLAGLFLVYSVVTAVFAGPDNRTQAAPTAPSTSLVVGSPTGVAPAATTTSSSSTTTT